VFNRYWRHEPSTPLWFDPTVPLATAPLSGQVFAFTHAYWARTRFFRAEQTLGVLYRAYNPYFRPPQPTRVQYVETVGRHRRWSEGLRAQLEHPQYTPEKAAAGFWAPRDTTLWA